MHSLYKTFLLLLIVATFSTVGTLSFAGSTVIVGGQAMFPTKDIIDNAVNSADHTTLVTAV